MIEAPAIFAVVLYLITAAPLLLVAGMHFLWGSVWLTRPRRAWFEPRPAG